MHYYFSLFNYEKNINKIFINKNKKIIKIYNY